MNKILSLICITISAIAILTGCSSSMTMEEYVQKNQKRFDEMLESTSEEVGFTIAVEDNTFYFRSQYLFEITDYAIIEQSLEESTDKQVMENFITDLLAEGVQDPVVILEHLDKDGEIITSFTFTP